MTPPGRPSLEFHRHRARPRRRLLLVVGLLGAAALTASWRPVVWTTRANDAPSGETLSPSETRRIHGVHTATQYFLSTDDGLSGIAVLVPTTLPPPETRIHLTVTDPATGSALVRRDDRLGKLARPLTGELVFPFPPLPHSGGRWLSFTLAAPDLPASRPLFLRYEIDESRYREGELSVGDRKVVGNLGFSLLARPRLPTTLWRLARGDTTRGYLLGMAVALGGAFLVAQGRRVAFPPPAAVPLPRLPAATVLGGFLITFAASVLVYQPVLSHGFLQDDFRLLNRARLYADTAPLLLLTNHGYAEHVGDGRRMLFYRPLSQGVAMGVLVQAFDTRPVPYHLTLLALHAAAATALAVLLFLLFHSLPLAWTTAVLWAVHPLILPVVGWITQVESVLAALGVFSTLAAYTQSVRTRQRRWLVAALAAFLFTLATKEVALVLVGLLLAVDLIPHRPRTPAAWRGLGARLGMFLILLGLFVALRTAMIFGPLASGRIENISYRSTLAPAVLADNLTTYTLWTFGLFDAERTPSQLRAALLLGVPALTAAWWIWRGRAARAAPAALGIVLFLFTFFPLLPIAQPDQRNHRWAYLPLAGATLYAVSVMSPVLLPAPGRARRSWAAAFLLVAVAVPTALHGVRRSESLRVTSTFARDVNATIATILPCLRGRPPGTVVLLRGAEHVAGSLMSATLRFLTHDQSLELRHVAEPPARPLRPPELLVDARTRTCTGEADDGVNASNAAP